MLTFFSQLSFAANLIHVTLVLHQTVVVSIGGQVKDGNSVVALRAHLAVWQNKLDAWVATTVLVSLHHAKVWHI